MLAFGPGSGFRHLAGLLPLPPEKEIPELPERISRRSKFLHELLLSKYHVDELYDALFVNRAKDLGLALGAFDRTFIDGLGVNGAGLLTRAISVISMWWDKWFIDGLVNLVARIVWILSTPVRMLETGRVSTYAVWIVLGVLLFLGYYLHSPESPCTACCIWRAVLP